MTATTAPEKRTAMAAPGAQQYLTFTLHGEEYAIDILKVQEIRCFSKLTAIPNAPHYVKGVLNLRGMVVPIVDLRAKFSMPPKEYDPFTVIIVVNVGSRTAGLLVDTVSDVMEIPASDISETPAMAGGVEASFIAGMGRVKDRLILLLEIDSLLDPNQMAEFNRPVA